MASCRQEPAGIAIEPGESDLNRVRGEREEDVDVGGGEGDAPEAAEEKVEGIVDAGEEVAEVGKLDFHVPVDLLFGEGFEEGPDRVFLDLLVEVQGEEGEGLPGVSFFVDREVEEEEEAGEVGRRGLFLRLWGAA